MASISSHQSTDLYTTLLKANGPAWLSNSSGNRVSQIVREALKAPIPQNWQHTFSFLNEASPVAELQVFTFSDKDIKKSMGDQFFKDRKIPVFPYEQPEKKDQHDLPKQAKALISGCVEKII